MKCIKTDFRICPYIRYILNTFVSKCDLISGIIMVIWPYPAFINKTVILLLVIEIFSCICNGPINILWTKLKHSRRSPGYVHIMISPLHITHFLPYLPTAFRVSHFICHHQIDVHSLEPNAGRTLRVLHAKGLHAPVETNLLYVYVSHQINECDPGLHVALCVRNL